MREARQRTRRRPSAKRRAGARRRTIRNRFLLGAAAALAVAVMVVAWQMTSPGTDTPRPVSRFMHIHGLAVPAWAPDVLHVSTHQGLIRIEPDGSWWFVSELDHDFMGFAAHPSEEGVLFSSGHPDPQSRLQNPIGFMVSRDGGTSWTSVALEGRADFHAMAVDHADGSVLYGWNVARGPGLYRSGDSGESWTPVQAPELEGAGGALSLAVGAADPDEVIAGTQAGLLRSQDGGRTWETLRAGAVSAVATVPGDPSRILAYVADGQTGLSVSEDGGETWEPLGFLASGDDTVFHIAVHPTRPQEIYLGTARENLYRTADGGATWEPIAENGRPA